VAACRGWPITALPSRADTAAVAAAAAQDSPAEDAGLVPHQPIGTLLIRQISACASGTRGRRRDFAEQFVVAQAD
jgi:hypothetical protein